MGIQKGDWLMLDDDLDISYIKKGIHTKDVFTKDNVNSNKSMGLGVLAIGAVLLAFAVYFIFKRKRKIRVA